MNKIEQITDDTKQKQTLILDDGTQVVLEICFVPMQLGWYITSLTYGDRTIEGFKICTSPNLLHQYKNLLPFGLACYTKDNGEPKLQQDFSSGYAELFLLTAEEVDEYQELLSG